MPIEQPMNGQNKIEHHKNIVSAENGSTNPPHVRTNIPKQSGGSASNQITILAIWFRRKIPPKPASTINDKQSSIFVFV